MRFSQATLSARLVLFCIADRADDEGVAFPRQSSTARDANVSVETVRRSIRTLEEIGELEVLSKGGPKNPPRYRVLVGSPSDRGAKAPQVVGQSPSDCGAASLTVKEPSLEPLAARPFAAPPAAKKERPRDPIWDALADLFGEPQTKTEKSLRGKTVRELREVNATPAGIKARAAEWPRLYPKIDLTQTALTKHWTKLGDEAGYVEPDADEAERAERNRLAVAEQQRMLDEHWRRTKETDGS